MKTVQLLESDKKRIQVKVQREHAWAPRVKFNLNPILAESARIELVVEFALGCVRRRLPGKLNCKMRIQQN